MKQTMIIFASLFFYFSCKSTSTTVVIPKPVAPTVEDFVGKWTNSEVNDVLTISKLTTTYKHRHRDYYVVGDDNYRKFVTDTMQNKTILYDETLSRFYMTLSDNSRIEYLKDYQNVIYLGYSSFKFYK